MPENSIVVVVANASDTFGLATRTSALIQDQFDYVWVIRTDGLQELSESVLYFSEGYEQEAYRFADQLEFPHELVELRPPEGPNVEGDAPGQLVLVLGNDWPDVTNLEPE